MYGFIITTAGEGLLARASAGEGLTLTEVWVGKGAVESAGAAKALTALLDPVAKATSTTPAVAGGQISMLVEYRNDMGGGLEEGFTLSEFGVMARAGDDAPTLLYYAALGDRAQPVPPIAEGLDVHRTRSWRRRWRASTCPGISRPPRRASRAEWRRWGPMARCPPDSSQRWTMTQQAARRRCSRP